mmetsp:Transcript_51176/g.119962  ORF Transcript_51176/g.119962 Transcript_51176/m.119962 type:complete len:368 (-) Transcript_51176:75-1178(-)
MFRKLACSAMLLLGLPTATLAVRPRDYSEELLAANLSMHSQGGISSHWCYKAFFTFVFNEKEGPWADILAVRKAWYDQEGGIKELLEESLFNNFIDDPRSNQREAALYVTIRSLLFNRLDYETEALTWAGKHLEWNLKVDENGEKVDAGSTTVKAFGDSLTVLETAKLGKQKDHEGLVYDGSILLHAWILALLEPYVYENLLKEGTAYYNEHILKTWTVSEDSEKKYSLRERGEAIAVLADYKAQYRTLVNAAGILGARLMQSHNAEGPCNYKAASPKGLDMTDDLVSEFGTTSLWRLCVGLVAGNFPGARELEQGRDFEGFAALLAAAKADGTVPDVLTLGDGITKWRAKLREVVDWIEVDYPAKD